MKLIQASLDLRRRQLFHLGINQDRIMSAFFNLVERK